ncbi:MAG: hypothetical protein Q9200_007709 [Gallowayella weberi]
MSSSEALTDEFVAQILARDAKDRSIKYSSYGLQAILPKSHGIGRREKGRMISDVHPRDRGEVARTTTMKLQNRDIQDVHTSIDTTRETNDDTEATTKITTLTPTSTNLDTIAGAAAEVHHQNPINLDDDDDERI